MLIAALDGLIGFEVHNAHTERSFTNPYVDLSKSSSLQLDRITRTSGTERAQEAHADPDVSRGGNAIDEESRAYWKWMGSPFHADSVQHPSMSAQSTLNTVMNTAENTFMTRFLANVYKLKNFLLNDKKERYYAMLFANPDRKTLRILIDTLGDLPDTDARLHATREIRRLIAVVSDYERRQLPMISDEPIEFNMRTAPQEIGEGVELLAALKKQEIHLALPPAEFDFKAYSDRFARQLAGVRTMLLQYPDNTNAVESLLGLQRMTSGMRSDDLEQHGKEFARFCRAWNAYEHRNGGSEHCTELHASVKHRQDASLRRSATIITKHHIPLEPDLSAVMITDATRFSLDGTAFY